jgi:hypothetical protein
VLSLKCALTRPSPPLLLRAERQQQAKRKKDEREAAKLYRQAERERREVLTGLVKKMDAEVTQVRRDFCDLCLHSRRLCADMFCFVSRCYATPGETCGAILLLQSRTLDGEGVGLGVLRLLRRVGALQVLTAAGSRFFAR